MLWNKIGVLAGGFARDWNYHITIMEEEKVPLAAAPGDEFYGITIAAMAAAVFILAVGIYALICYNSRKRIEELREEIECYRGWNLWRLRETVSELELQKAEKMVEDMKESFSKNLEPLCANGKS